MRLMLLRHAKSEKAEPGMRDHARRLNGRGREDAGAMGSYMARHKLRPDIAMVSTAVRTRETWELLSERLDGAPAAALDERLYDATTESILEAARETGPGVKSLLLVGHNPGLHDLARHLIASGDVEARERLNEGLPTSGLVVIDFAGSAWRKLGPHGGRLERFVSPRSLAEADGV